MSPGFCRGFFVFYGRFFEGVLEKVGAGRWFFVPSLWGNVWQMWRADCRLARGENFAGILDLFCERVRI